MKEEEMINTIGKEAGWVISGVSSYPLRNEKSWEVISGVGLPLEYFETDFFTVDSSDKTSFWVDLCSIGSIGLAGSIGSTGSTGSIGLAGLAGFVDSTGSTDLTGSISFCLIRFLTVLGIGLRIRLVGYNSKE